MEACHSPVSPLEENIITTQVILIIPALALEIEAIFSYITVYFIYIYSSAESLHVLFFNQGVSISEGVTDEWINTAIQSLNQQVAAANATIQTLEDNIGTAKVRLKYAFRALDHSVVGSTVIIALNNLIKVDDNLAL